MLWVREALEERIGDFFSADGGGGAVAGINDGIVREGVEAFSDGFEKSTHVAAGEVGAADAALEEGIASDDEAVGGVIKADSTGRMAREMDNLQVTAANGDDFAVGEMAGHTGILEPEGEAELLGLIAQPVAEECIVGVGEDGDIVFGGQVGIGHNMVYMQMGVDNGYNLEGIIAEKAVDGIEFAIVDDSGVDDCGFSFFGVVDHIAVNLEKHQGEDFYE